MKRADFHKLLRSARRHVDRNYGNRLKQMGALELIEFMERKFMKKLKLVVLTVMLAAASVAGVSAQTPADILSNTNLPTVGLQAETFGISSGAVTDGSSARASLMVDYDYKSVFARGEVQSSAGSQVIESLSLGGGVAKTWPSIRLYGVGEVGYSWTFSEFQLQAGGGVAWQPMSDGILQRFSTFYESRVLVGLNARLTSEAPKWINLVGIRYSF